jgi:probable phosphoglycerate mutase
MAPEPDRAPPLIADRPADAALPRMGPAAPGWSGELLLVRHAQTGCTLDGSFCGAHDPPLSAAGQLMAGQLAGAELLRDVEALVCSPSIRSLASCRPLADRAGLVASVDRRLRELDFGRWEQLRPVELAGDRRYARWLDDPANQSPPGGETGRAVLDRTVAAARHALAGAGTVALITHKAPIRLLLCQLFGQPLRGYRSVGPVSVASISRISFRSGRPELLALGDVRHLPAGWRAAPDFALAAQQ